MPELSDLLHRSVDDIDVPRPHLHDITAQGRALRTRRRLGAAVAAAVVLGAIGGGVVLADPLGGETRGDIAKSPQDTPSPYDEWSAWAQQGAVTVGDKTVSFPGQVVVLAQTSAGVVAKNLREGAPARFVLVTPDGTSRPLSIPADAPTVDGDMAAPRVAWVETGTGQIVLHVWDVAKDVEVGRVVVPSPGTTPESGSQYIRQAYLDGEAAYLTVQDETARRVLWATDEVTAYPLMPASVRAGVATGQDGTNWVVLDAATGEVRRKIDGDPVRATVSPDGHWLFLGTSEAQYVEPVEGGRRVALDGISIAAAWSRDGSVVGQKGTVPTVLRCTTDGRCTERVVGKDDGSGDFVLPADFLNAG